MYTPVSVVNKTDLYTTVCQ